MPRSGGVSEGWVLLAKSLFKLEVDVGILAATGIGILANDASVWPDAESRDWAARATLKWRQMLIDDGKQPPEDHLEHKCASGITSRAPFEGLKAVDFIPRLDLLEKDLLEVNPSPPPSNMYRLLAAKVLLHGFARVSDLDGLTGDEVAEMGNSSWEKRLLVQALEKAKVAALRKRATWAEGVLAPPEVPSQADGAVFVDIVTPFKAESAWTELAGKLEATAVAARAGPAKSVAQLMRAKHDGVDVLAQLDQRAFLSRLAFLEPSSIPALCSGVRCWHFFACGVLGYMPSHTLPPRRSLDVCRFMAIFKVGTTAANYVYHVRNGCKILLLTVAWFDESASVQIAGAKKLHLRSKPLNVRDRALMSRVQIHALVKYNDAIGLVDISVLVLACWYFLFRVQSEALPLECGAPHELVALPTGRHSAVWVSADTAFVRLRRRKHKPTGSVLKRACTCASTSSQFCIVHRLKKCFWLVLRRAPSCGMCRPLSSRANSAHSLGRSATLERRK